MASYPSTEYLNRLKEQLSIYFAIFDVIKPKRLVQIEKAYKDVYNSQYDVLPVIKDIEISHLLGCNDVVIPHFEEEYDRLTQLIDRLKNGYIVEQDGKRVKVNGIKDLKQFGELFQNMKGLVALLNKDFEAMKQKDISYLVNKIM